MKSTHALVLALILASSAPAALVQPATGVEAGSETLVRSMTLGERGMSSGLQWSNLSGQEDIYFPLPAKGIDHAWVHVEGIAASAFKARRSLQVLVDDRIVRVVALADEESRVAFDVPVDPSAFTGSFAKISFRYTGSLGEDRCIEDRIGGDFVSIDAASGLSLALTPEAFDSVATTAALMPREARIIVPDGALTPSQAAAALRLASAFGSSEVPVRFVPAAEGRVSGDGAAWSIAHFVIANEGEAPLRLDTAKGQPVLVFAGDTPDTAAAFVTSSWRELARDTRAGFERVSATADNAPQTVPLIDTTLSGDVTDRLWLEADFRAQDLPAGMDAANLSLDLALAADFAAERAAVSVFVNGTLVATASVGPGVPSRLTGVLPAGLVSRDNTVRVLFQRQPQGGDCRFKPQSFTAQVLPTSSIGLKPRSTDDTDFFAIANRVNAGLSVYVPNAISDTEVLSRLSAIVAPLLSPEAPLTVLFEPPPVDAKGFIAVADTLPAGFRAPIELGGERVELRDGSGTLVTGSQSVGRFSIVQIVRGEKGSGLWIRPAQIASADQSIPKTVMLDRGDVALIDDLGLSTVFSSSRPDLIAISYPERAGWLQLVDRYWSWIVVGGWILVTLVFAFGFGIIMKKRSS